MPDRRRLAAAVALTLALVLGTLGSASAATGRPAFREVAQGARAANLPGESLRAVGRVLRSRAEAARTLGRWQLDAGAASSIDFARESLVVVLAPYQPTGGYRARLSSLVVQGRQATVTAAVRYEGGDFATQALERPWVVVAVRRSALARVRREVRVRLK